MSNQSTIAILHNIRSVHNVASMFRTADGAGVSKIYLTGITPGPFDRFGNPLPQFAKVSLGAEKTVAWEKVRLVMNVIKKLKQEGYTIIALEQSQKSVPYDSLKPITYNPRPNDRSVGQVSPVALLVGNEVKGISPALLKNADIIVEIPMRGKKESLNVSVAFGIAVYALGR